MLRGVSSLARLLRLEAVLAEVEVVTRKTLVPPSAKASLSARVTANPWMRADQEEGKDVGTTPYRFGLETYRCAGKSVST